MIVYSPFDGAEVGQASKTTVDALARAMDQADHCFLERKRWLPAHERTELLRKMAQQMQQRRDEVIQTALL